MPWKYASKHTHNHRYTQDLDSWLLWKENYYSGQENKDSTGERRLKIQAIFPASTVIPPHHLQSIINMYIVQNGKVKNGRMIQNNPT